MVAGEWIQYDTVVREMLSLYNEKCRVVFLRFCIYRARQSAGSARSAIETGVEAVVPFRERGSPSSDTASDARAVKFLQLGFGSHSGLHFCTYCAISVKI